MGERGNREEDLRVFDLSRPKDGLGPTPFTLVSRLPEQVPAPRVVISSGSSLSKKIQIFCTVTFSLSNST